ncbi:aldo/keto reductase [Paenibacillus sp. JDR-2]|uniref:aldo/keto reductase n=1 Tax=Paenibacillus sp. (strain JDR-2) TaxID=324057 RepID=UPI00016666A0|nr:aldo/keto reductase [Paenibacillus sp. JDR-2]ACS99823.1 aldo/keto reductase [Paenibacillus sp. JDR-2]
MKQVKIPGTDLTSSSLALGGVPFGSALSEEESFALMDAYAGNGGNMVDTAEVYANWLPGEPSVSERTIGKWMKSRGNRNQLIVTTKGAHPRLSTMLTSRMSPEEIREDVEGSLGRLQADTIDLYWLHRDDNSRDVGEIVEPLNDLVKEGKIRCFGCSNWTTDRIQEAQLYAASHGLQPFSANQPMWSLASVDPSQLEDQTLVVMDEDMLGLHRRTGLAAIPYSSQAQGLFSKLAAGRLNFDNDSVAPKYRSEHNRKKLERIRTLAEEKGISVSQVVLGYMLSQPFPTIPIIGCHTHDQLEDSLKADEIRFTEADLAYLTLQD